MRTRESFETDGNSAIALLIINQISQLPEMVISSIRKITDAPIYVGFVDYDDVVRLSIFQNLFFVDLSQFLGELDTSVSEGYKDYNNPDFYRLVRLKWYFYLELLDKHARDSNYIIYSDFDVCWIENPENYFRQVFEENNMVEVCVQDATAKFAQRALCMGMFAFRNSSGARDLIQQALELHNGTFMVNPRLGDDWVISELFARHENKSVFWLLPQMSFPVGLMANTFLDRSIFGGLVPPRPYIFHANYLVGRKRKVLMLENISLTFRLKLKIPRLDLAQIMLRRLLLPFKRTLFKTKFSN